MERAPGPATLLVVVVVGLGLFAPVAGGANTVAGTQPESLETLQEFDRVEFRIAVGESGDARWVFHYERTLSNDTERENFRTFAEDFNRNETGTYVDFKRQARALTSDGANATGRSMSATDFAKEARIEGLNDNEGVVEMAFTWTGFARTNGTHVLVGDVFEGGLYVGPDQKLVFSTGPEVGFAAADPAPDSFSGDSLSASDTITYVGESEFTDNRPRVTYAIAGTTPTATTAGPSPTSPDTTASPTEPPITHSTSPTPGGPGTGEFPWVVAIGALILLVGGAAAFAWRGQLGNGLPGRAGGGTGGGGGDGGASAAAQEPAIPDEELLTDEDRVLSLLEDHGGRMKQVDIVDETGWSKSKVSMLLSDMEETEDISKLRVGRENIISLEGSEPDATRSPHDDR